MCNVIIERRTYICDILKVDDVGSPHIIKTVSSLFVHNGSFQSINLECKCLTNEGKVSLQETRRSIFAQFTCPLKTDQLFSGRVPSLLPDYRNLLAVALSAMFCYLIFF